MKILSVISQKGGVGKTTLSVNLAIAAEAAGYQTVLLDLDPQASSATYGDRRTDMLGEEIGPAILSIQAARLPKVLKQAQKDGNQLVILDTPPHSNDIALHAAKVADLILVPCCPSFIDLEAMRRSVEVLKSANKLEISCGLVSMASPTPSHQGIATELEEALSAFGLEVEGNRICRRSPFVHACLEGQGVVEFEPKGKAAKEIRDLLDSIGQRLSLTKECT